MEGSIANCNTKEVSYYMKDGLCFLPETLRENKILIECFSNVLLEIGINFRKSSLTHSSFAHYTAGMRM